MQERHTIVGVESYGLIPDVKYIFDNLDTFLVEALETFFSFSLFPEGVSFYSRLSLLLCLTLNCKTFFSPCCFGFVPEFEPVLNRPGV